MTKISGVETKVLLEVLNGVYPGWMRFEEVAKMLSWDLEKLEGYYSWFSNNRDQKRNWVECTDRNIPQSRMGFLRITRVGRHKLEITKDVDWESF